MYTCVIPVTKLIGAKAPHWYKLFKCEHTDRLHTCYVVDHLIETLSAEANRLIPAGAVQLATKVTSSHSNVEQTFQATGANTGAKMSPIHGLVTISDVTVNGLPTVKATDRIGVETHFDIEPNAYAEFACMNSVRHTDVVKSSCDPLWDCELKFPFSGDAFSVRAQGSISCKVYHKAPKNAANRKVSLGSVSFSLAELSDDIKDACAMQHRVVRTQRETLFIGSALGGKSTRFQKCGVLSARISVEPLTYESICEYSTVSEHAMNEYEKAAEQPHRPRIALWYAIQTAHWLHNVPTKTLLPPTGSPPLHKGTVPSESHDLAMVSLTVHRWKNLLERTVRPSCKIYLENSDGEVASGVFTVMASSIVEQGHPEDETVGETVRIHIPVPQGVDGVRTDLSSWALIVDLVEEGDLGSARHGVSRNVSRNVSFSTVTETYGRIRLSVSNSYEWEEQRWHEMQSNTSQLDAVTSIELSGSVHNVQSRVATQVIVATASTTPPPVIEIEPDAPETTNPFVSAATPILVGAGVQGVGITYGVREFFDTIQLELLSDGACALQGHPSL
jgi:hypothetical protein